jgi:SAM-dependent methyltransferase
MEMDSRIAQLFAGGEVVLDAGCGDGMALDAIAGRYRIAVGMDIDKQRMAPRTEPRRAWTFALVDLNGGIPLSSETVDAVHANQVIEHLCNPLHFAVEALRVLRPRGVFVVTTPNVRYLPHVWKLAAKGSGPLTSGLKERRVDTWDDGHIHFFTPSDLTWVMREAGFRDVKTTALIGTAGRLQFARPLLDRWASAAPVKNFLSGNTLLVAVK